MALDFMSASNKNQIDENTPLFSLEEPDYNRLFDRATPINQYPILSKIDDYYSDTTILYGEIMTLIKELEQLVRTKQLQSEAITDLIDFLKRSFSDGLNIYVYCD